MSEPHDDRRAASEADDGGKAAKKAKKTEKQSETRQLDPWERPCWPSPCEVSDGWPASKGCP